MTLMIDHPPIVKLKIHVNMFTYSLSLFWIILKTLEN
jgi:hypothetical protein